MRALLQRLKSSLPARLMAAYGQSQAGNYAAGLAFNAFMSMFPLILGLLSIAGFVVRDPRQEARLRESIVTAFPQQAQEELLKALTGVQQHAGLLGIVSVLGLIYSGSNLFSSMEFALAQVFGTRQRDMLRQKLMAVAMMLVFVVALLLSVAVTAAVSVIDRLPVPRLLAGAAGFLVGAAVMMCLLVVIYRVVPNRTFRFPQVVPGAVVAGVCIEVLTLAWPLYARISNGWNTYGQQFALFFLLATWLYFLCQFLLLGAVLNRMLLGEPEEEGLVAAPASDAKSVPRPVEAIEGKKPERKARPEPPPPHVLSPPRGRGGARGILQAAAVLGVVIVAPLVRGFRGETGSRAT